MTDSAWQAASDDEGGAWGLQWPRPKTWAATARPGTADEAPTMSGSGRAVAEATWYGGSDAVDDGASREGASEHHQTHATSRLC